MVDVARLGEWVSEGLAYREWLADPCDIDLITAGLGWCRDLWAGRFIDWPAGYWEPTREWAWNLT
jgi:hypothetical protein